MTYLSSHWFAVMLRTPERGTDFYSDYPSYYYYYYFPAPLPHRPSRRMSMTEERKETTPTTLWRDSIVKSLSKSKENSLNKKAS